MQFYFPRGEREIQSITESLQKQDGEDVVVETDDETFDKFVPGPLVPIQHHRDKDKALIALKKGTQLIKYSRKGKPKFRAFRLTLDERALVWLSHGEEKSLKLSLVSRIIPGQRTAVFRRYKCPEKDHLSFSLIYKNGDRSLDLICKDKAETDIWFTVLSTIIQQRNRRTRSEVPDWNDVESIQSDRPFGAVLEFTSGIRGRLSVDWGYCSDAGSEQLNMQPRLSSAEGFRFGGDGFRLSVSSTPSCSTTGSGPDDIESLGDVYIWGELWSEGGLLDTSDVLIPKPLESNVVLDVHQIGCGVRHVALVTRQGEVFTWGEESGGRLGHGVERNFTRPQLVEFLSITNVDTVSCGEYHSCAVTSSGDLFTWGDGIHNSGILGHGTHASHWIPKRVSGPIEGTQVLSIACGTWHSALVTMNGKLFTFGDGIFGVLGHGDRESAPYPKEVQQLSGLRTIKVACGVWHTAAIVEVMNPSPSGTSVPSRKLFTWGDGDKYRLGHGNKNTYLLPTCVSNLIDYNFHQVACGHNFTIALTTSGHVFTMGSAASGQLGNPQADGKLPCLVQDKLVGEFVEEIACGAHHVAVLTSRSEVYTWGKGANGRLGHGDVEDRKIPTFVEALKDRHVKNVACGSNFTTSICIHKWVSGADQSVCSGCRQAFGFTRKRHNCYNCGLVHCHSCSSRKAVRAALAPTPSKPHRVCDACYNKLKAPTTVNASLHHKRSTAIRRSIDSCSRLDRPEKSSRILLSPITEPVKYHEIKSQRSGGKSESVSMVRASQVPSFLQLKDIAFPSSFSSLQTPPKPAGPIPPQPPPFPGNSAPRSASPYSRRPSPTRCAPPSRGVVDSLRKSNELLSQEISKLQNHLKSLKQKCEIQDKEIQKLHKHSKDTALFGKDQSNKCKAAKEAIRSFTCQLKEIFEKLPPEVFESETFKELQNKVLIFMEGSETASESQTSLLEELQQEQTSGRGSEATSTKGSKIITLDASVMGDLSQVGASVDGYANEASSSDGVDASQESGQQAQDEKEPPLSEGSESLSNQDIRKEAPLESKNTSSADMESMTNQSRVIGANPQQASTSRSEVSRESIEQFAPGVYITYVHLRNGTKVFRRVRFSKRKFAETQAEEWWKKNRDLVLRKYIPPPQNNATSSTSAPSIPTPQPLEASLLDHASEDTMKKTSENETDATSSST